jgi:voltage-gated potassium channel
MIKDLIVDGAYFLNTSSRYQSLKKYFYNILENDNCKHKRYFDLMMMGLILISISILIHEVKYDVSQFLFDLNDYVITLIFFIEYLLRMWVVSSVSDVVIRHKEHSFLLNREFNLFKAFKEIARDKLKYILSVRAIIDLLAILPFFHQLRLLRIFILLRVFKLFRYARSFQTFSSVFVSKKFEFITLLVFASMVILISSILMYVIEANNPNSSIKTLYDAVYWSIVTISTVGYGDMTPTSVEARFVAMLVIIAGVAVLAFTTSLVVSAFTEKLDEIREEKHIDDLRKLHQFYIVCGYENIAQEVCKNLTRKKHQLVILDEDPLRIEQAQKDGFKALNYDPGIVESYQKLRIDIKTQVKAILCLRESDVENVYTTLTVRSFNKDIYMLSLLMNDKNRDKLTFAGVNEILYSQEIVGLVAREFVGKPVAFEVIHEIRSELNNINIEEIVITQRIASNFNFVAELQHEKFRLVLLGIYIQKSKHFFFNPMDDLVLEEGNILLLVGNVDFIAEFEKFLNTKRKNI